MRKKLAILVNLFVGIMSFGAWGVMALFSMHGSELAAAGVSSLKFFTVLSNLLNGGVSLVYGYLLLRGRSISDRVQTWKLASTAAVSLTFITVMCFLGPLYGLINLMRGANFWLHLVLPVASILSFLFLEQGPKLSLRKTMLTMIPTFLYEIGYLTNIFVNGIESPGGRNDFYGFLFWGWGVGALIAVGMLLVTWGIACLLNRFIVHRH